MLGLTNSELETVWKKLQTKETKSECQKNQEADSVIREGRRCSKIEGMRQKQELLLCDMPVLRFVFCLLTSQVLLQNFSLPTF